MKQSEIKAVQELHEDVVEYAARARLDCLYKDTIEAITGARGFSVLRTMGYIELCGCGSDGRPLYVF